MIKNIIFDIDKTLIKGEDKYKDKLQQIIFEETGVLPTDDEMGKLIILPTKDFYSIFNIDLSSITYQNIKKKWYKVLKENPCVCFDKIEKIIKALKEEGYFIGIISSRINSEFEEIKDVLKNILLYISDVVTSDLVENPKPYSDSMEYLVNKHNLKLDETVYIGDSILDKEFSKNSNCKFIQAAWDCEALENTISVTDISKLIETIKNI